MSVLSSTPVIAIVGRPNVGKSTLVNRIVGSRKAIVDDMPGVTRDRRYYDADWQGQSFLLVDTGGMVPGGDEPFSALINRQVDIALAEADVVVFLVDAQSGLTELDKTIADRLRRSRKKIVLAVNKVDSPVQQALVGEFYSLGFGEPMPLSAMHGTVGVGDLLDNICGNFPRQEHEKPEHDEENIETDDENNDDETTEAKPKFPPKTGPIRVAIVGRPNVGKSSILNVLLGEERTIVSEISGTTRDAIDVRLVKDDQEYILVDTAGIRKKGKVDYGVEMFSVDRALKALADSDVTVLVLDATENRGLERTFVTDQDKRLVETANSKGRALVIAVNKWDLIESKTAHTVEEFKEDIIRELPHARYAPVVFVSAKSGQRVDGILGHVRTAWQNWQRHASTSLVNRVILEAVAMSPPPSARNKHVNILYATQPSVCPPTFVVFVNDATLLQETYVRYLEKRLRESLDFEGTPIIIRTRSRDDKKK